MTFPLTWKSLFKEETQHNDDNFFLHTLYIFQCDR